LLALLLYCISNCSVVAIGNLATNRATEGSICRT